MPAVNVSADSMERIERIKENSKWNPSNREVVDKAIKYFEEKEVQVSES